MATGNFTGAGNKNEVFLTSIVVYMPKWLFLVEYAWCQSTDYMDCNWGT